MNFTRLLFLTIVTVPRWKAFATYVGVSNNTVRRWINGEFAPNQANRKKIVKALALKKFGSYKGPIDWEW